MATTSTAMHLQPQRLRGASAQRKRGASRERTVAPRARTAEQQSLKQREQYVRFEPWFLSHLFSVPLSSPTPSLNPRSSAWTSPSAANSHEAQPA